MNIENRPGDSIYETLVFMSKAWIQTQVLTIRDHFPNLEDGTKGLEIGYSKPDSFRMVLRPNGTLVWVDHGNYQEYSPISDDSYLSRTTLNEVAEAIESVRGRANRIVPATPRRRFRWSKPKS